jgi:hypothetical protein
MSYNNSCMNTYHQVESKRCTGGAHTGWNYPDSETLCFLLTASVIRVPGYKYGGLGFDSRHYQIFWEVVGLERGPLSLVSTIEELLGRNRKYTLTTWHPSIRKSWHELGDKGGRSVGILLSRTKAKWIVSFVCCLCIIAIRIPDDGQSSETK